MLQTIEVDVPEGWEAVAYRKPLEGENFLDTQGVVCTAEFNFKVGRGIIVRRTWKPAIALKPGTWVAMSRYGMWVVSPSKMRICGQVWHSPLVTALPPEIFSFDPPPCADWQQSQRQIT